jgi:hypothetical protein
LDDCIPQEYNSDVQISSNDNYSSIKDEESYQEDLNKDSDFEDLDLLAIQTNETSTYVENKTNGILAEIEEQNKYI